MATTRTLGLIGLGAMGAPMASHLLEHHGRVVITGRERKYAALENLGAEWVDTPVAMAEMVDAVLVMLPDLPQLEEVLFGPHGLLAAGRPLLLMVGSTTSPTRLRELADDPRLENVRVVDCPVSGGVDGATSASLSIMLGGSEDDTVEAASWLSPCGRPVHLGPLGAGQVAKACNQLVVTSTILALGEASVLAERSGIDLGRLWDLLSGGYAGSNLLQARRDKLVAGDYTASGVARYAVKDLAFATDVAQATQTHAMLLPTLVAAFDELVERGFGDCDIAVTRRFVEER